ncbi:MAG TPA: hypothetical protein VNT30_07320 [Stellaceae bacterium]|nr:hypothetical protein [Stellaceae bacterium]
MRVTAAWVGKATVAVALTVYPVLIHASVATGKWTMLVLVLNLLQAAAVVTLLLRSRHPYRWWVVAGIALMVATTWYSARGGMIVASGARHAAVYIGMLALFGGTLLPGREALITIVARKVRGGLPGDMVAYTRRVTWAWCWFFAAQLLGSLVLYLFASADTWSLFVNVLEWPLTVLMFACEYGYRLARFRHHSHGKIADLIRVFTAQAAAQRTDQAAGRTAGQPGRLAR